MNPLSLVKRVASDNTSLPALAWLLKYNTRSSYRPSPLSESADSDKLSKFPLISASNNSALFVPPVCSKVGNRREESSAILHPEMRAVYSLKLVYFQDFILTSTSSRFYKSLMVAGRNARERWNIPERESYYKMVILRQYGQSCWLVGWWLPKINWCSPLFPLLAKEPLPQHHSRLW